MKEQWKGISGYESHYQVSDLGRVRSLDRVSNKSKHLKGKILKSAKTYGYHHVGLHLSGDVKNYRVHKLVSMMFLRAPDADDYNCINHIDGNKDNNCASNLEWCNHSENMQHSYDMKLRCPPKTTKEGVSHSCFISPILGVNIANGKAITMKGKADIKRNGFTSSAVYNCVNGKGKTHKGYIFKRIAR